MTTDTELFPTASVASDSPLLAWLKRHGLETAQPTFGGNECPETGEDIPLWVCRVAKPDHDRQTYYENEIAGGDTREEACDNLSAVRGLPLWNQ